TVPPALSNKPCGQPGRKSAFPSSPPRRARGANEDANGYPPERGTALSRNSWNACPTNSRRQLSRWPRGVSRVPIPNPPKRGGEKTREFSPSREGVRIRSSSRRFADRNSVVDRALLVPVSRLRAVASRGGVMRSHV